MAPGCPFNRAGCFGDDDWRGEIVGVAVLIGDVFDEEHEEDVVFVLTGAMPPRNSSQEAQREE